MFGAYLKQVREDIGLTQKALAAKLNLANTEFASIDPVTISRWERGSTAPTVIKAIKVLRVLTTDLMPYLSLLPDKVDNNLFEEIAEHRFKSPWARLMMSSYDAPPPVGKILDCPLLESRQDNYLANLKHFFDSIDLDNKAIFDIDLYQYQLEQKSCSRKFIDQTTKEILGHRITFLFDANELKQYLSSPYLAIPLQQSRSYSSSRIMAMCTVSRYSSNEAVFWVNSASGARFVATHANIHDIYFYAIDQWSVNYMESLGAEKITFDTPHDDGVIKIGNQSFRRCLYRVDSANWLSRSEVISLLKK
ncbi:helix-turn-helix domain-containing protein [Vibrio hyugaensis]|uniref:helix-turn-helix domain-containing protein n=1 Tax=Vibrio hyugaensis TaxID=1534743 RepID=UPI0005ED64E0|nr:helix-turn-helix transcriptional regulator [Vibrio hyugaensis]